MSKRPSDLSFKEVSDNIDAGKAIPELLLKRHIIDVEHDAILLESELLVYSQKNNGVIDSLRLIRFRGAILNFWLYISEMTRLRGIVKLPDEYSRYVSRLNHDDVFYCYRLGDSSFRMDIRVLHRLLQFCIYAATEMNLINLLLDRNNGKELGIDTF